MNATRWIARFERNREPEVVDWDLPVRLPAAPCQELARSLAIFQLGETGDGSTLRHYGKRVRGWEGFERYEEALDLFVREENRHAAMLAGLVHRFGGSLLRKQWSNSVFRFVRRLLHLEFEIQILLTAELLAEAYYEVLRRHGDDEILQQFCRRILGDEAGHTAFHAEFFGCVQRRWHPATRFLWEWQFRAIHALVCAGVWWDHRSCFRALGVPRSEYGALCGRAMRVFRRRLKRAQGHGREAFPAPQDISERLIPDAK